MKCDAELSVVYRKVADDGMSGPVAITETMLRTEQVKQRDYFATTAPLMEDANLDIYHSLLEEKRLTKRKLELESVYKVIPGAGNSNELNMSLTAALITDRCTPGCIKEAEGRTGKLLKAAGQSRADWEEDGERWAAARDFEGPGRTIYRLLLVEKEHKGALAGAVNKATAELKHAQEAAEVNLAAQVALGVRGSALDAFQFAYRDAQNAANAGVPDTAFLHLSLALASAEKATNEALEQAGQTRQLWEEGGTEWKRQFHFEQLTKLKTIYSRLLKLAASRTLELRTVKAHSFGQKQAKALMGGIFKKRAAMAKDIELFNEILKDLPAEHAPHSLKLAAFNFADDVTPGLHSEKARDTLFHLHVLKSDILGTLDAPNSFWARSGYVRVGIAQLLRKDRCEEELLILKREWMRNLKYSRDLMVNLLAFIGQADASSESFKNAVCSILWGELEGAYVILRAAELARKRFDSLVFPLLDFKTVVERVEVMLEREFQNVPDGTVENNPLWMPGKEQQGNPTNCKEETRKAEGEELFPTDGVPMSDVHAHENEVLDDETEGEESADVKTTRAVSAELFSISERLESLALSSN